MEKWKNMPPAKTTLKDSALTEQFFGQVSESIQLVFDLTSRIDERVKMLIERQKEIDDQIEKLLIRQDSIFHRLATIEANNKDLVELRSKVQNLEVKTENIQMRIGHHDHRWSQIFDSIWKLALMCIAGYILYKLGLQAPP